jgi:hypothetical protein
LLERWLRKISTPASVTTMRLAAIVVLLCIGVVTLMHTNARLEEIRAALAVREELSMCAVSAVGDYWRDRLPEQPYWPLLSISESLRDDLI